MREEEERKGWSWAPGGKEGGMGREGTGGEGKRVEKGRIEQEGEERASSPLHSQAQLPGNCGAEHSWLFPGSCGGGA